MTAMITLSAAQIAGYAYKAGFRGNDLTMSVAVALAESGGRADVTHINSDAHHSVDYGLWQINGYWHADLLAKGAWSDPQYNAQMAYIIVTTRGGWSQWSTFKEGAYIVHMPAAIAATKDFDPSATVPSGGKTTPSTPDSTANMGSSGNGINSVGEAVSFITNPHTWLRLAMISAGGSLILIALVMLGWNNTPDSVKTITKAAAKTAAKAAVV
jgi:hypothetical protein